MKNPQDALRALSAKPVDVVLAELIAFRKREAAIGRDDLPLVKLLLRSGRQLRGWVLDAKTEGSATSVLLNLCGDNPRFSTSDVLYVDQKDIEALLVTDATEVAPSLSGVKSSVNSDQDAPSRLEIKRQLKAGESALRSKGFDLSLEVNWESVEESDKGRRLLAALIDEALVALQTIAATDKEGKKAVGAVRRVVFEKKNTLDIRKEKEVLKIGSSLTEAPSVVELTKAIESIL